MSEALELPGPRLKAEREKLGFSAEKVANDLHLDPWVVDALEAADYARIGPAVFVKGHLKRYAELLGVPPAEIVAGFQAGGGVPAVLVAPRSTPAFGTLLPVRDENTLLKRWAPLAGVGMLLLLLAAGVFWWKPWKSHARATTAVAVTGSAAAASSGAVDGRATVNVAVPDMAAEHGPAAGAVPAGTALSETPAGVPSGHVRLKLSFAGASWVDVRDAEGRRVFSGPGEANSVKNVAAVGPLHVFLGSAGDVQIEINDRAVAIGPQFYSGKTARFEAGADATLRPDAGPPPAPAKVRGTPHAARPPG